MSVMTERDFDRRSLRELLRGIAIRHYAALVAIAEESSPSRAASRLGWTDSTLSRHLLELEYAVGTSLVARDPGAAQLTEGGKRMLPHAEAVLAQIETARAELASVSA